METTMAFTPMKRQVFTRQYEMHCITKSDPFFATRVGATRDVSGVASFLCSEDAAYITGETIVVAGGAPSRL